MSKKTDEKEEGSVHSSPSSVSDSGHSPPPSPSVLSLTSPSPPSPSLLSLSLPQARKESDLSVGTERERALTLTPPSPGLPGRPSLPLLPISPLRLSESDNKSPPLPPVIQFPLLREALQANYAQASYLKLPLSEQRFPIKDVSLTISDHSEQDQREKARQLEEEKRQESEIKKKEKAQKKPAGESGESKEKSSASAETAPRKDTAAETKTPHPPVKQASSKRNAFWSTRFRLEEEWHRIHQSIAVSDLFTIENSAAAPRRILVEGRAGVGKTTFSQYIVYQWAQHNLFAAQFDYVFWIPLRQCLAGESGRTRPSMEAHLAAYLFETLPRKERSKIRPQDIETILSAGTDMRTLLILDGFDEVAHHLSNLYQPFYKILKEMLEFRNVIVTTRDYQIPSSEIAFDRHLVNIGFTDAQISAYIQSYINFLVEKSPPKSEPEDKTKSRSSLPPPLSASQRAKALENALKQNPRFWGLAHVPLNLALICESWSTLQVTASSFTLVQLYQNVLLCFLKRDAAKSGVSQIAGNLDSLSESYALELLSLGAIAWQAMQSDHLQLVLHTTPLNKALGMILSDYSEENKQELTRAFEQALTLGLLRSDVNDDKAPLLERRYYFIHLTFQEYFAANYVLQSLQGRQGERAYEQALVWITQRKYEPRQAMMLGFLAGLTTQAGYDQALQAFWYALLSPPYDLIGVARVRLLVRCLSEANWDKRIPARKALLEDIKKWLDGVMQAEFRLQKDPIKELAEPVFFAKLVVDIFKLYPSLAGQCDWKGPKEILKIAEDKTNKTRLAALATLNSLGVVLSVLPEVESVISKIVKEEKEPSVRQAALKTFGELDEKLTTLPETLNRILQAAGDEEEETRQVAGDVLVTWGEKLVTRPELWPVLLKALENKNAFIRQAAVTAFNYLDQSSPFSLEIQTALLKARTDENESVRSGVIKVLNGRLTVNPEILTIVLKAAVDKQSEIRCTAIKIMGGVGQRITAHPDVLKKVLAAVEDPAPEVQLAALTTLGKGGEKWSVTPSTLTAILKIAQDETADPRVRKAAVMMLGHLGGNLTKQPDALNLMLKLAKEAYSSSIREAAVKSLCTLKEALLTHEKALKTVLSAISDKAWNVRSAALKGLPTQVVIAPSVLPVVLKAAEHEDPPTRAVAIITLSQLGEQLVKLPPALMIILQAREDTAPEVQQTVSKILQHWAAQWAKAPKVLTAVLKIAERNTPAAYAAAITLVSGMGESLADESVLSTEILKATQHKNDQVRTAGLMALGALGEKWITLSGALKIVLQSIEQKSTSVPMVQRAGFYALAHLGNKLFTTPEALHLLQTVVYRIAVASFGFGDLSLDSTPDIKEEKWIRAFKREFQYLNQYALTSETALKLKNEMLSALIKAKIFLEATDFLILVQIYLRFEEERPKKLFNKSDRGWINNSLPILLHHILSKWPGIIVGPEVLQVISGNSVERVSLSPKVAHPLARAIKKDFGAWGIPHLSFSACLDKKPFYPQLKKPDFKAVDKWSLASGIKRRRMTLVKSSAPAGGEEKLLRLDTSGRITLDFTVSYQDLTFGQLLGKGGGGEVYEGKYNLEAVAIKRFALEDFSPQTQQEIRTEATMMAGILSEHLVRLRGICLEKPYYCVVMEYLPQGDMYHLLQDSTQSLPWSQRYRLAADLAIGLHHLHERGVLHRDLKSLNVLLYEVKGEWRAKLSDFGLAVLKQNTQSDEKFTGSLLWSDPALLSKAPRYSKETDIYSLGVVFYELATRQAPYAEVTGSLEELEARILSGERLLIPEICPSEFTALIRECWSADPKARPSARGITQRLETLYQAELTREQSASKRRVTMTIEIPKRSLDKPPSSPRSPSSPSLFAPTQWVDPRLVTLSDSPAVSSRSSAMSVSLFSAPHSPESATRKSRLQPETARLQRGQSLMGLILPKTSEELPELWIETIHAQGKHTVYQYTLRYEDGAFSYEQKKMPDEKQFSAPPEILASFHLVTAEQSSRLRAYFAKWQDEPLESRFIMKNDQVLWREWCETVLAEMGVILPKICATEDLTPSQPSL